jgi:hypothetical protein
VAVRLPVSPGEEASEGEAAMICVRCQQPIQDGEDYESHIPHVATGAAPTVYLHIGPCKRVPSQTYPSRAPKRR